MAKWTNDSVLDALLKFISGAAISNDTDNNRNLSVDSDQPTTRTEAITTYKLATTTLTKVDDFTIADDTSGRKVTTAQKSGITVDTTGTATHVSICDLTNLLVVTTCTSQALTAGNTVTIPAFAISVSDPT